MSGQEMRVLSPSTILGYGFPETSFRAGLESGSNVNAVDAGKMVRGAFQDRRLPRPRADSTYSG